IGELVKEFPTATDAGIEEAVKSAQKAFGESALAFEQLMMGAGFPAGTYINLFATNEQIQNIIADERAAGASVTGSERAGSAVAEASGKHMQKVVHEMGGSDPFIVLDSS